MENVRKTFLEYLKLMNLIRGDKEIETDIQTLNYIVTKKITDIEQATYLFDAYLEWRSKDAKDYC